MANGKATASVIYETEGVVVSPVHPPSGYRFLDFTSILAPRLTHYLFRFPAKFHAPVAHSLIREYTVPGQTLLDPFCGSGTMLLSAAVEQRHAIGSDIDPLAVFVSKIKTHRFSPGHLRSSWSALHALLKTISRSSDEYGRLCFTDIDESEYEATLSREQLWTPAIPNLFHWFRRYVIVDLARILDRIEQVTIPQTHREFFRLIFASIIRKASNADPVPVSGLEVTAHMKRLHNKGRVINPFRLFFNATEKGLSGVEDFWKKSTPRPQISVIQADATSLSSRLRKKVDAVITSPPYHNAVDYYRRHQLEMFWLGLTKTQADRLELLPRYVGRSRVRILDPLLQRLEDLGPLSTYWYTKMKITSRERADAFAHYMVSMKDVFAQLAKVLRIGGLAIFVVGHSNWNGSNIPTSDLFLEIAGEKFRLKDKLWYPIKNRYMSYGRRNGANINQEYVLVFGRQV